MPTDTAPAIVGPEVDHDSAPFWAALGEHRLSLQRCTACQRWRFPRMPSCPYCGTDGGEVLDAAGTGTVYSFVTVHIAADPAFADAAPYNVVTVMLDEGVKVLGGWIGPLDVAMQARVQATFVAHDGWTSLAFQPV
jgi:uncharacterized protein